MKMYEFVGGKYGGRIMSEVEAVVAHEKDGNGYKEDCSEYREQGACVHREELDNELKFKGYCGPMWNGEVYLVGGKWKSEYLCTEEEKNSPKAYVLRYETWEVYDMLSR